MFFPKIMALPLFSGQRPGDKVMVTNTHNSQFFFFSLVDRVGMSANPLGPCYCFGMKGTYYWNNCPPGWLPCGSPVESRQCCV